MQIIDRLLDVLNRCPQRLEVLPFAHGLQGFATSDQRVRLDHPRAAFGAVCQVMQLGKVGLTSQ